MGYRTNDLEITQLVMLPFIYSVGVHMSWMVELITGSMLEPNLLKTQRTIGRRRVMSNDRSIAENNKISKDLFNRHRIIERLGEVMRKVDQCGEEIPEQLKLQIEWLHDEMDNIRKHASNKCRKILTPESEFSLEIHWGFSRIHAYKALLKMTSTPHKNYIQQIKYI